MYNNKKSGILNGEGMGRRKAAIRYGQVQPILM